MTKKNQNNVDMDNKHNLEFDCGQEMACDIPYCDGIQPAKTLLCLGCVVLNVSKGEFLSLLAE